MSIPNDLSNLENMQKMKNMLGDGFMEFLKPSIKTHQNENILKMLDLAKDKPESLIELLSVAIFHHNIPVIKHIIEKINLTENDLPYLNALNFHNSIFPDNSPNKLTDAKDAFIDVQVPFILMAGIGGHIDVFEKLMNSKLINNKKINGVIGLSRKNKNIFNSNVIGACAYYGKYKLLDFILKNYKDELDIGFVTTEKKAKNNKMGFSKEYTGYTPAFLAIVGPTEDKDTLEVLKMLNKYNAKFDTSNWNKDNILHLATKNKKFECTKYICEELGLKNLASEINKEGYSPLSLAQHLNEEKFISYFHDMIEDDEKKIEENVKELLAESVNKETKKGKKKKGKKKAKNNDIDDEIPGYLASSEYQETLKEIVPKESEEENNSNKLHELLNTPENKKGKKKKKENNIVIDNRKESIEEEQKEEIIEDSKEKEKEDKDIKSNPKPEKEDNIIIGLKFKNNKKNKKLKLGDKHKKETNIKKDIAVQNKEPELDNNNQIEQEPEKIQESKPEKELKEIKKIQEQNDDIKKEKKLKPKKTKKEKRKDKELADDFIEQMRKREKEKQELKRLEEERKRKEQEEKEQKEREEQQRILEEERLRKEQEEKQRLEELKKLEEEKLRQEEENRKKEEEEEKSDKEIFSYSEEENNNINNISEEKEEEKEIQVSMEDYDILNKNYLELEKRLSNLEQEKTQITSLLTKLYLENKSKGEIFPNSNEENINDLMYLANKELANKNEIINDLENKLSMLDLTNINNFSVEKLKKFKEFYSKNLQIINDALK